MDGMSEGELFEKMKGEHLPGCPGDGSGWIKGERISVGCYNPNNYTPFTPPKTNMSPKKGQSQ